MCLSRGRKHFDRVCCSSHSYKRAGAGRNPNDHDQSCNPFPWPRHLSFCFVLDAWHLERNHTNTAAQGFIPESRGQFGKNNKPEGLFYFGLPSPLHRSPNPQPLFSTYHTHRTMDSQMEQGTCVCRSHSSPTPSSNQGAPPPTHPPQHLLQSASIANQAALASCLRLFIWILAFCKPAGLGLVCVNNYGGAEVRSKRRKITLFQHPLL